MKIIGRNGRDIYQETLLFLIGNVGVLLEAWELKGDLDHRYPFKMMSVPPHEYYVTISNYLVMFAILISISVASALFFGFKMRGDFSGYCSMIICTLIFPIGLWMITSTGPYANQLNLPLNYDSSSALQRHGEFLTGTVYLLLTALAVYTIVIVSIRAMFAMKNHFRLNRLK